MACDDTDGSSSCAGGRRKGIGHGDGADNVTSGREMAMVVVNGSTSSGNADVTMVIGYRWW